MNRSYSKIRHIQESNQRLEGRLLSEAIGQGSRMNLPKVVSQLKNYSSGETGTFSSSGTMVTFMFPNQKTLKINIPNFMGIPKGTWKINGTIIEFSGT